MEEKCCKTTQRSEEDVKKLVNRLSRSEGQISGIKKMDEKAEELLVEGIEVYKKEFIKNL